MMSLHMGAAGALAGGKAMAEYLLEQQIDVAAMRSAAYYGQTAGVEEAISQGHGAAPLLRTDIDPELAEALGLKPGQVIDVDALAHILSGHRADGEALPVQITAPRCHDLRRHRVRGRQRSAPRGVSRPDVFGTETPVPGVGVRGDRGGTELAAPGASHGRGRDAALY